MAYAWTDEAEAALQSNTCFTRAKAYIDVEQNGTGSYGVNVIDITDYVLRFDEIERASLAVDKNYQVKAYTLAVNNDTNYFTPNLMSGARTDVTNIWQSRPSGEAEPRMCRLYIKLAVTVAGNPSGSPPTDSSVEEQTIYRGKILDLNFIIGADVQCEITARDDFLDALDVVLASSEGGSDSIASTGV